MTFDLTTARRIVLKHLSGYGPGREVQIANLESDIGCTYATECGATTAPHGGDWRQYLGPDGITLVHQVIWDLIVQRVLTVRNYGNYCWAAVSVTDYGADVLKEQRWSPYDPDGYLKELARQAPKMAGLCGLYAEEALTCFRSGSYLAATVMLGAASEGVILDLFQRLASAMRRNGKVPEVSTYEAKLNKEMSVFRKHELFRKHFDPIRSELPATLTEDLNVQFDGVFNLIRYYRNEAGHPTGTRVGRMSAFTSLVLFVPYCKRIEEMGDWLESNADKLTT